MNGDVGVEAPRPRPLSAGLWTIFSWLRRSERSSSESISSVGSDRTAASFDFLAPIYYPNSQAPITLPINSPTDSYKRRVQERNLRRQRERGVTLHRKYGLWREEGGYDGLSLPPANKNIVESSGNQRCRRAASECFHRRAAYVPGKRHAPPPPTFVTTSLPRSYKRKRPAPKPPLKAIAENKENIEINNNDTLLPTFTSSSDKSTKQNIVNNVKGTGGNSLIFIHPPPTETHKDLDNQRKDKKLRTEKSFLKQIFENKKRHSADISHVKFLPSISELDKQAAEIIENNKLTHNYKLYNEEHAINNNFEKMWMCTKCLRKYNTSIKSCVYCVPKENELTKILNSQSSSSSTQTELSSQLSKDVEEKKKLREILKEMKDSLPKKSSQKKIKHTINVEFNNASNETPTLRIGTTINENKEKPLVQNKFQKFNQEPTTSSGAFSTGNHSINKRHTFIDEITNNSLEGNSESLIRAIITSNNLKKPLVQAKPNEDSVSNTKAAAISKSREVPIENAIKFTHDNLLRARDKNQFKSFENSNKTQPIKENKITTTTKTGLSTHTPLSISSLLNPIYQPKATTSTQCFQVASKTNINTEQKTVVSLNSDVTSSQLNLVTKIPAKDLDNTNAEKIKFEKEPTNASPNQIKLDPKTVSQIIKKSIEQKEKQLQENEAKIKAVRSGEYIKRRELINQLESSIAKGDETAAAEAASKLAKLRLSCSVLSYSSQILAGPSTSGITIRNPNASKQENFINKDNDEPQENKTFVESEMKKGLPQINKNNTKNRKMEVVQQIEDHKDAMNDIIPIEVWIEDKIAARGPVRLNISQRSTVADLKREALSYLGIEIRLQRWIVGKSLCTDDNLPIISLAGTAFDAPFYLCLVESDENKALKTEASSLVNFGEFYTELIKLEQQALILNSENFECGVCLEECAVGDGAVLRDCLHTFCRECLSDAVRHCEEPIISCPAVGCPGVLQDREIRALLSTEDYEKWLARGLAVAESGTRNNFHCRTPDCSGWAFCEPSVRVFPCPVCKKKNCIPCQALHDGETCEQYQKKLREVTADNTDEGTQALLDSLISRGEALRCPECQAIITKKWGCDWVKCSACKTEICWVTKGRRWGPGGRGDTSGGCKCGVEGKKCHPTCSYCH